MGHLNLKEKSHPQRAKRQSPRKDTVILPTREKREKVVEGKRKRAEAANPGNKGKIDSYSKIRTLRKASEEKNEGKVKYRLRKDFARRMASIEDRLSRRNFRERMTYGGEKGATLEKLTVKVKAEKKRKEEKGGLS